MLATELKELLKDADANTLRLVHAARMRDLTILREFINTGVSKTPAVDAAARMETEIWRMNQHPIQQEVTKVTEVTEVTKTTDPLRNLRIEDLQVMLDHYAEYSENVERELRMRLPNP